MRHGTAMLAASLLLVGGAAHASTDLVPDLPEPTGRHATGVTTLRIVDPHRVDPWIGGHRELMVSVFYPALTTRGHPAAPHMSPRAAAHFAVFDTVGNRPALPDSGVAWATTATHSHTDAPALPGSREVLLYSPGTADPRTLGTGLAEDLASRGHVVVTIDHPGETSEVEFPGGRLRTFEMPGDPRYDAALMRTMLATRIADTFTVLDTLARIDPADLPRGLRRGMDFRRVGMYGHSMGGTVAVQAMHESQGRAVDIDAAVNLEGYLDYSTGVPGQPGELLPAAVHGAGGPVLLVSTERFHDERYRASWSAMLRHRDVVWRDIPDASHDALIDMAVIVPRLQSAGLMTSADRDALVGPIDPARAVPLVRGLVARWFA